MPDSGLKKRKTIFVVGADDYNLDLMKRAPDADNWNLIPALSWEDVQPPSGRIDFNQLYYKARQIIDSHDQAPDAIIGYLDFPVMALISLLCRKYGLAGPTPESVARCEHKYWMRLVQSRIMPDRTPTFAAVNPFEPEEALKAVPSFPFWLKPIKGHSLVLGYLVRDKNDLETALHACRQKIHFFGEPFNHFLEHLDDLSEVNGTDGNFAIAESLISASRQFTLEAYAREGEVTVYGAIDSRRGGMYSSSFSRYQYPADLPDSILEQSTQIAETLLKEIGFDNAAFNVEFFWDPASDVLHLLEINPRISKSHGPLFHMVDGSTHHKVAIDLALGKKPSMPRRNGKDAVAGKFMLRSFEADGVVRRVPSQEELAELRKILPDMETNILVEANSRLSDLFYQDSYSFELAEVFLGGPKLTRIEAPTHRWLVQHDLAKKQARLEVIDDRGVFRLDDIDLTVGAHAVESYTATPGDFSSARGVTEWVRTLSRGDWSIHTRTRTCLSADSENFYITAELDAYEGDTRVRCLSWNETIPRDHV